MVEHSLDEVSGHKHLFGKHIQQFIVDGEIPLHTKLWHLPQGGVDELYVAAPPHISLDEQVHDFVEHGLSSGFFGHMLEHVIIRQQGPVLIFIGELCRNWSTLGHWAAMEVPQDLWETI